MKKNNSSLYWGTLKAFMITLLLSQVSFNLKSQDGYCMVNGTTTGGSGGPTVEVSNASDLISYATSGSPCTIMVSGSITLSARLDVASNKTIIGVNSNASINGNLLVSTNNVIIRYLNITNPSATGVGDGISIWGGSRVWVDHVGFVDCADGSCDITHGAEYVTVSYCKFSYVNQTDHRFAMILGNTDDGDYNVTLHHNWFADRCDQRMPSGSYSNAHVYNNYFSCSGNYYCTNARVGATWRVENNYYNGVGNPCYYQDGGIMQISGQVYSNCTGSAYTSSNGSVSVPYSYTLTSSSNVPGVVTSSAGNTGYVSDNTFNGTYSFIAAHSGKAMDVYDWGTSNGTNIIQWDYWSGECQQFVVTPVDGKWHSIKPVIATDKSLDVYEISTENGANINIWDYWSGEGQQFQFEDMGNGYYHIIARNSGKCLDVESKSTENGANIQQWDCSSTGTNQQWGIVALKSANDASGTISENPGGELLLYPNPSSEYLNISVTGLNNDKLQVVVYNSVGELVYIENELINNSAINIGSLPSGIYVLEVSAQNKVVSSVFSIK